MVHFSSLDQNLGSKVLDFWIMYKLGSPRSTHMVCSLPSKSTRGFLMLTCELWGEQLNYLSWNSNKSSRIHSLQRMCYGAHELLEFIFWLLCLVSLESVEYKIRFTFSQQRKVKVTRTFICFYRYLNCAPNFNVWSAGACCNWASLGAYPVNLLNREIWHTTEGSGGFSQT
jgi:hypothetical protein